MSFISTIKLRYERLISSILFIFNLWNFKKLFRSQVMASFAYCDHLWRYCSDPRLACSNNFAWRQKPYRQLTAAHASKISSILRSICVYRQSLPSHKQHSWFPSKIIIILCHRTFYELLAMTCQLGIYTPIHGFSTLSATDIMI